MYALLISIISEECMRDSEGSSSFILTTSCGCCAVSTFQVVWYPKLIPVKSIYYAMDRVQLQPSVNTPHLVSTAVTSLLGQEYTDELHP